jgi:hypothetical protein
MNAIQDFFGVIFFFLAFVLFFSPIIISLITGNWWFMFLFAVSWIAGLGTLIIVSVLIED